MEEVEEDARNAVADEIAEPITDLVMWGVRLIAPGSENVVAGEEIDLLSEVLLDVADPARLPSEIAEAAVSHLAAHLMGLALGPVGPVVVIFAGKFAGELTHQVLDGGEDTSDVQDAVRAVEIVGTFADARIGRLAESAPFRNYISDLVGSSIGVILRGERRPPTITAAVAVYEVRSPEDDSTVVQVRPASFAVLACVPETAIVQRSKLGPYEVVQLTDGLII